MKKRYGIWIREDERRKILYQRPKAASGIPRKRSTARPGQGDGKMIKTCRESAQVALEEPG